MNIAIDLDEVVINLLDPLLAELREEFNIDTDINIFKHYSFHENHYSEHSVVNQIISRYFIKQVNDKNWLDKAAPYAYAKDTIDTLRRIGKVHFITSRPTYAADMTASWLHRHHINYDSLHVVGHGAKKSDVAKGHTVNADVFVDDYHANLEDILENTRAKVFMVDKPYNKDYIDSKAVRIKDLSELPNYLTKEI